jgi:polysaccharide chain length determinant protein (PEP-CTERM system associated)
MIGKQEMSFEDILGMLRRRIWWILVPSVIFPIAAYLLSATLPYRYTSTTLVLVEQQKVPDSFVKSSVTEQLNTRLATMQEQILSRTRLQPILERFGLFKNDVGKVPMEDLVDRLRRSITVNPIQANLGLGFTISFTAENPRLAQQVCSEITSMFIEENLKAREQISQGTTDFLSNQLDDAKRKLDEMDSKLAGFKEKYMGQLPGQESNNIQMINTLNTQLDATTQQLGRAQQDRTYLNSILAQQESQWKQMQAQNAQGTPIATPHDLEQQIATLQANLSALESRYTDAYPDVVKTKHQLAELQKKLDSTKNAAAKTTDKPKDPTATAFVPKELLQLRLQSKMLDDTLKTKSAEQVRLQTEIRKYEAKLQLAPAVEEQYKSLTRDHDTALQFYNQLLSKKSESEMATDLEKRQQGEQFKVMDPPNLPERPTFPNRPAFAAGGGTVGLALGLGIAFLLEMKERVIRTERDVEFFLQLPTLVAVPWVGMNGPDDAEDRPPRWKFWKRNKAAKFEEKPEHDLVGV